MASGSNAGRFGLGLRKWMPASPVPTSAKTAASSCLTVRAFSEISTSVSADSPTLVGRIAPRYPNKVCRVDRFDSNEDRFHENALQRPNLSQDIKNNHKMQVDNSDSLTRRNIPRLLKSQLL
jgi:hypothetical protein